MTLLPLTLGTLLQIRSIRRNLQKNTEKKFKTPKTKITICQLVRTVSANNIRQNTPATSLQGLYQHSWT